MRSQRIEEIKQYIYDKKTVTLDEICENFHVSKSTLRRDLNTILQSNDIKKIYGGVTALPKKGLVSFDQRNISNLEIKRRIAASAAGLIQENDIIFIDSGTTTLPIIDFIKDKRNITVLTNNVEIILHAIPYENINIISLSGALNRKTLSFTGSSAIQVLQNYNISKAFMASTGFSISNGITNSSPLESDIKRAVVQRSQKVFLLADSSKCDVVSLITYCDLDQISTLVTDQQPSKEICNFIHNCGNEILVANKLP
ncbi:MAG: DeoR/GlpR family DNA-binding transcription regulator [Oscillospiraceae bacterium]|jgi:DeoR family myo-inositol catabolism operon transcriptional repressor|nr:DeoR/GlpR family DNA-binding transcription regulator [Oscillospiraceae bacterium]